MPAQKRGSEPHESQPKLRKLDEDGEALPSKTGPATNSLITGQMREKTEAAPRTKKKRSSSGEGETLPAKSSKQDSLPEDSSDPPLQKANLLKATSASCGEAPSHGANSNASLKRSASTESDDDLNSDGSKADFFRERDDEDKARCIRKYSNKTKPKAEESSDLHEGLSSSPADPVQMDHNYGRFSDASSPESTEDANEKISSAGSFSEQGKQEMPQNAKEKVSTGTSEPETGSIEASVKIDSAAEESNHNELNDLESHILLDNKASASSGEVLDSVSSAGEENEKKDEAESIRSQKDVDNETLAQSEETLCSVIVEVTSSRRGDESADEETDLTFRPESQTHLSAQSVPEEDDQSIRCKFKDGRVAGQLNEFLLNKTTSAPEQVDVSSPSIETEENTTSEHVAIPETQTELKSQVSSAEEINAADSAVGLCDDVNKELEKSEDQDAADVPHPAFCPGPLAEGELNHGSVIPDRCTDTSPECKSVHEENQIEMLAEKNLVPESQTTPEVDLQSQENHLVYDSVSKAAAEVKEVVISHCFASPDTQIQEDCNPDVTVETQSHVYGSATTLSACVYEDHVEKLTQNKECESLETLTVEASEISEPVPPSADIHDDDVTADECENSLEHAGPAEGQSAMETQTVEVEIQEGPISEPITDEDQKDPENAISTSSEAAECVEATAESPVGVELQTETVSEETRNEERHIQMNQEVSEHTSGIHVEAQRCVQNETCAAQVQISRDVEAVVSSEEASNVMEGAEETQMVSKPTTDMSNETQTVLDDKTFKNCEDSESVSAAVQSQTEVGEEAKATSEVVSYIAPMKVIQSQMVSEPITHMPEETHRDLENANCVTRIQTEDVVEAEVSSEETSNVMEEAEEAQTASKPTTDVSNETQIVWEDAAQSQTEVGEEAKITSEEVSIIAPMEGIQNHMVSDAHRDLENANCAAQIQMEDCVETKITSEEASNVASIEEMQTQMVSEPPTGIPEETHKEPESSTLKTSDEMSVSAAAQSQTEDQEEAKSTSDEVSMIAPVDQVQTQMVSEPTTDMPEETHRDLDNANCVAQIHVEDGLEAEVSSEEASNVMEEAEEAQTVSKPTTDTSNETQTIWDAAAAESQTEVGEEAKSTSEEASNVASIEEMQTQMVSEPPTGIPEETHKEPESSTLETGDEMSVSAAAQSQTADQEEAKSTSEEASNVASVEEMQTQMVSEPPTGIPEETYQEPESSTLKTSDEMSVSAAAQSQTADQEETKSPSDEVSMIAPVDQVQTQMVSEPTTDMPEETHRDLDNANCVAQIQIEDGLEAEVSSEEASNVMEEAEETQMVSKPTTDMSNKTQMVWEEEEEEDAASQSQTEVGEEAKAASEEASNVASIEEMQTQMVIEPPTGIPEETHKEPESSTLKTSDEMSVSAAAQSQTEDQEEAKSTSDEVSTIAPVDQVQTQMVSEPTTDMSVGFLENKEENVKTAETNMVEFESVAVTMEVEDQSNPAASVGVNEIQTEVNTQMAEKSSNTVFVIGSQTQTNLDVGGQTEDDTSEDAHEDMMVETPQNMKNDDKIHSENVTEQENQAQLESRITTESETAEAAPLVEIQSEKNQNETSEQVSAEETQNQQSQPVAEQTTDPESVNVAECRKKTETSSLSSETLIQKSLSVTEPDVSQQQSLRSSSDEDENKVTENQVDVAERPNEMEKQAAEMFEDISQPTTPEQPQSLVDQEVSELIRDTQGLAETHIQRSLGPPDTVKDLPGQVEENSRIPSGDIAEMTDRMEVAEAPEDVPLPPATELTRMQRGQEVSGIENDSISTEGEQNRTSVGASENHPVADVQTSAEFDQNQRCEEEADTSVDEAASGCENVPEVLMETSAETAAVSEHQNHLEEETGEHAASDMKTTLLGNDTKAGGVQVEPDDDVTSGPMGSDENNKVEEPVSNMEGGAESSDVIVFVCDQSDVQAPEEQIMPEFHDNQVVYEPISSPESISGEGICTTIQLGETISFLELQNTETRHTASEESRTLTSDDTLEAAHANQEEIVKAEICVLESQAAAEMEVDTVSEAQLEQSNTTEELEQVAAVSSTDDIIVTEDAAEKREMPAEVTEQVQEDAAAAAPASDEVTDGSSEEYVILEPVPENKIHFDIVTQAVAESGLSASLCPADVSRDETANQSILKDPQQAEVKEDEAADGGECPVLNSSGDVLDQEMETNIPQDVPNSHHPPSSTAEETDVTNFHSQHAVEDAGLMVVENEKCHLDLQQLQILEDIEIGREIVVAEEENEDNDDIIVIKPPDQPTEDSPEQSYQSVKNKKSKTNETTKSKTEIIEKKVTEVPKFKKQEMNTQARTKARLAALAEQKAAASRRSANRQQLNLLALCQEIAEDIATDSMLLKKIEEEKQAAAAAAEAAKAEARQELPPAVSEEADPVSVAAPAEPEESSGSVTPPPEPSPAQPSTAADDSAETKPAADPPKRRFFISQISVPLKAHEKKKLTRYQRLRQVELQREKMSWARVKKLKSDQANQMFSDVDWQASFSGGFLTSPPMPPPAPSPPKTFPASPAETSQPAQPKAEAPTPETPTPDTPTAETPTAEPAQTGPPKPETSKTEPPKPESCEAEPVKAETSKTEPPPRENRRSTRQSKALAAQAAPPPAPAPKVTRSASKKTLPATPPPMPNGLNAQKQKPVEYKPYRPRPKYSPDDFELDDDDLLLASPARPRPQQSPAAPCIKAPASSQPTNQTRLKPPTAPPGQISGQSKPAAAAQAQSRPSVTATPPPRPAPPAGTQLKSPEPVSPSGRPKPAASAAPQSNTSAGAKPSDSVASETKPAAAAQHLPSQERENSQKPAGPLSSPLPLVECSKVSDGAGKLAGTTSRSAPENSSEPAETEEQTSEKPHQDGGTKPQDSATHLTDASLQKEVKKLKEADKDSSQTIIDAGQKHFGPVACSMCGMLYSAANPEDESQHLLFHNQFISAVKYVGWKKERILAEFPDGKIILVLPDDPKYALKKVEEIREMVDNDLGFQQVETKCPSQTKTFLFISIDKKVAGCLIAENIQEGYRVIEEPVPEGSEGEKVMFERQRAWCCSTTPEPAICGISRIWVVSMMRRRGVATRMIECLRNNFIYGSYLSKDEIAFSDPTPDGKLFAMHYFGTSQFLVYNFVSGPRSIQPKTHAV